MSTSMLLGNPTGAEEEDEEEEEDEQSEEGSGVDLMNDSGDGDSSEEEDEDSEAEREVRKDFIVDEDDDSSRREERRRKKKRRKHRSPSSQQRSVDGSGREDADDGDDDEGDKAKTREHGSRKRRKDNDSDDNLDEDDLELLEENTGVKLTNRGQKPGKLKRLRRRRSVEADSDDDRPRGLNNIFDDDDDEEEGEDLRATARGDDDDLGLPFDDNEMAGFIEDDTASESDRQADSDEDEDERAARKEEKRKAKAQAKKVNRSRGLRPAYIEGITAEAWQEITEVFGNGQDYAWALDDDDDEPKPKELKDIYEPSEIASRMLTDADEAMRALDIPERMQVASTRLPPIEVGNEEDGFAFQFLLEDDLAAAAEWMSTRISIRGQEQFVLRNDLGDRPPLYEPFLEAIRNVVRFINVELLEVPFIWAHRADYLIHQNESGTDIALLDQDDLWRVSTLSIKFRSLVQRKREIKATYQQLGIDDDYFDELVEQLETVEEVSDVSEWLSMKYAQELEQAKTDRDQASDSRPLKRPTRESEYHNAKKTFVSDFANTIGISATELARDYVAGTRSTTIEDPGQDPIELAATFTSDEYKTPERALAAAKMIAVHEISRDPFLRREVRRLFRDMAVVSVTPTDKGINKIDEMNPFYTFKYLKNKPLTVLLRSPQFLQILAAERDGLVKSFISLPETPKTAFMDDLSKIYTTDYTSTIAEEWNKVRGEILETAVEKHLIPLGADWARTYLREEEEEHIGRLCKKFLEERINVAPYCRHDNSMDHGEVPSVLAISHGHGDPKRDSVICIFVDSEGHVRENLKLDNMHRLETEQAEQLTDLLRRRRPQVVVVGGFSPNTHRLVTDFKQFAQGVSDSLVHDEVDLLQQDEDEAPFTPDQLHKRAQFETTFVFDEVARLYQNSPRAAKEFPDLSVLARYCVGIARYIQSPLNEYAALGEDLVALTYDPAQKYLQPTKVREHLDRALIDVTNKCGIDINKAVRNSYYQTLLPYVAGLGPRKASGLVKKIELNVGGTLANRSGLISHTIMTKNVWMNAAGFLRISQDDIRADLGRRDLEDGEPEVLDETRIHPEDYAVARKMAADAMEVDEEDTASFKIPSQAVLNLMEDDPRRLDDLSLDDFASELRKLLGVPKRLTLYAIRDELQGPYADRRPPFVTPDSQQVFAMLTGETRTTLDHGLIVPVRVTRVRPDGSIIYVRLDSGIEGTIEESVRTEDPSTPKPKPGQTLPALVTDINLETFTVELNTQESHIRNGDADRRKVPYDRAYWDEEAARAEQEQQAAGAKRAQGPQKRIIKHPKFQNLTASQAEEYLANQPRGECVIRPSSRDDHLAVCWKVAEGVYQHLAVKELNKANEWQLGSLLQIAKPKDSSFPNQNARDAFWSYSDLDDLIVNHIRAMSIKVNELMASDKFKGKPADLEQHLSLALMAEPSRSPYGFAIDDDPKKAGQFVVSFRANESVPSFSWPIKVVPGAYVLHGAEHGDVMELCNGFKRAYLAQLARGGGGRLPVRTPHHIAGGATPQGGNRSAYNAAGNRTNYSAAGGRTPYAAGGRTPNPYAAAAAGPSTTAFASGRTPIGAAALAPGRTPNILLGRTPLDPRASGRTPNPYAAAMNGTPQQGGLGRGTPMNAGGLASGRTPAYAPQAQGAAAGGRTPAYTSQTGYGNR